MYTEIFELIQMLTLSDFLLLIKSNDVIFSHFLALVAEYEANEEEPFYTGFFSWLESFEFYEDYVCEEFIKGSC